MQCPSCQTSVDSSVRFCPACGTGLARDEAPRQPEDVLIGQVLGGKYRVVQLLGEGGMGAVYEGEQQLGTTKRKVAIKTLHPHLSRDPKIKARFEREVGTVAELEHPNTIQVFDFGSTADGILYIVMEFLHGKSLANALEKGGAMAPERVDRIIQQICGSLEEAHGRGIVHRDLKPDNVVLVERAGKKDFVKVLDFGIAKRSHEEDRSEQKLTQQGTVLGTPPYMSPEQFTGMPVDARSDIYSLGVMTYEMLTGRLPFQANTAWEWASQHMTQPPFPIEALAEGMRAPLAMREAVKRALAKSPADRFQTVMEFGESFSRPEAPRVPLAATAFDPALGRQRTEVASPLDLADARATPDRAPPPAATAGYTPAAGNVAFPTPGAIPESKVSTPSASKGRAALLLVAGAIAAVSLGAIFFASRGGSHGDGGPSFEQAATTAAANTPPSTALTPAAPSTPQARPAPGDSANNSDVPPLTGGAATHPAPPAAPQHLVPHVGPVASAVQNSAPAISIPTTVPSVLSVPPALPVPPSAAPRPPRYDGPECQTARKLRALGHPREAENWALTCLAKGGVP